MTAKHASLDPDHGNRITSAPTIEPITVSGWYEHTDGSVGEYHWRSGRLQCDRIVAGWSEVPREPETNAEISAALGESTRTREHYTTNIRQLGVVSPLRAKLTATSDGSLVWCELYYADDTLKGCGPSLVGLPSDLHDAAIARLSTPAAGWPMYWSRS